MRPGAVLHNREVRIPVGATMLDGDLVVPADPAGIVIFAHGSGSSRHSPRNRSVAGSLQIGGLATLLMDLLTPEEEEADRYTGHLRFDIELLARRLAAARRWAGEDPACRNLPVGYFGASTGAAAALVAAAGGSVGAVVSRGGRPDLAGEALSRVLAPTLLIVGGDDFEVLELNRQALRMLAAPSRLEIVPGATHLFEEPGALERVAGLARDWFLSHLAGQPAAGPD